MQIAKAVRTNVLCRKARHYSGSQATLMLVQLLSGKSAARFRTNTAVSKIQMITFVDAPRVKGRLRENNAQGVSDAPNEQFHAVIITSYNNAFKFSGSFTDALLMRCGRGREAFATHTEPSQASAQQIRKVAVAQPVQWIGALPQRAE